MKTVNKIIPIKKAQKDFFELAYNVEDKNKIYAFSVKGKKKVILMSVQKYNEISNFINKKVLAA